MAVADDVKDIKKMVTGLTKTVSEQRKDIDALQQWRLSTEAARAAVDKYKADELAQKNLQTNSRFINSKAELLRTLIPLILALTALVYAFLERIK